MLSVISIYDVHIICIYLCISLSVSLSFSPSFFWQLLLKSNTRCSRVTEHGTRYQGCFRDGALNVTPLEMEINVGSMSGKLDTWDFVFVVTGCKSPAIIGSVVGLIIPRSLLTAREQRQSLQRLDNGVTNPT